MKTYYNKYKRVWYHEGNKLLWRLSNGGVFYGVPTVEQLLSWGFEERPPHVPTPEELLAQAKQNKINEIIAYNDSNDVNEFFVIINDTTLSSWLTPDQRANYKNSLDSAEILGLEVVHPVINGVELTLSIAMAKLALAKIQVYADRCYNVTEQHKATVNALNTIEAVEAFDITLGYPVKETFSIEQNENNN